MINLIATVKTFVWINTKFVIYFQYINNTVTESDNNDLIIIFYMSYSAHYRIHRFNYHVRILNAHNKLLKPIFGR